MSVATSTAVIIGGVAAAAGGVASAAIGGSAAKSAANAQVAEQEKALAATQAAQAPYEDAGKTSLSQLMAGLQNGTFGPNSIAPFKAPTLADVQNTPGYEFTQQQGDKGILAGAAAAGGAINGGTLKSLAGYNTNLANTTYGTAFTQSLQSYAAALQGQQQAYQQLLAPAQLGEAATQNQNAQISQSETNIGNAQAAGDIGQANAVNQGIGTVTNSVSGGLSLTALLNALNQQGGGAGGRSGGYANPLSSPTTNLSSLIAGNAAIPPPNAYAGGYGGMAGLPG